MSDIKRILKFAMRMEKDAGDFYEFYMDKAVSEDTRKLFAELAGIEKHHFSILKNVYDKLEYSEPPITISWVVDENFKAIDPHILADNSDILPGQSTDVSDISIIRMAYMIETDFKYFYEKAVEAAAGDQEAKGLLTELAGWEKQHSEMFRERYQKLLDKYWSDMKVFF